MTQEAAFSLIDKRLDAIAGKFSELAEQYGAEVVNAALTVVQINAAQSLVIAVLFLGVLIYAYPKLKKTGPLMAKQWNDDNPKFFIGFAFGIVTIFSGIIGVVKMLNVWTWIAVFEPKLVIARKLLAGVL